MFFPPFPLFFRKDTDTEYWYFSIWKSCWILNTSIFILCWSGLWYFWRAHNGIFRMILFSYYDFALPNAHSWCLQSLLSVVPELGGGQIMPTITAGPPKVFHLPAPLTLIMKVVPTWCTSMMDNNSNDFCPYLMHSKCWKKRSKIGKLS